MAHEYRLESILAADCGNVTTSAVLIDLVKGQYRFVAHGEAFSTLDEPNANINVGLRRAVREVERISGRRLLSPKGYLLIPEQGGGIGVDVFVATTSAATPLEVIIIGLTQDFSIERARDAVEASHAEIGAVWCYGDNNFENILHAFERNSRCAVLLTGGVDDGAKEPVLRMTKMLADVLDYYQDNVLGHNPYVKPHVIYGGNPTIADEVAALLTEKTTFHAVANVSAALETEFTDAARNKIEELYQQHQISQLPGYRELKSQSISPVLSTSQVLGYLFKLLGQYYDLNVLGMDVGGATTNALSVLDGDFAASSCLDLGVGQRSGQTLDLAGYDAVARWFPFSISSHDVYNRVWNKTLHSATIPETSDDLWLEQALAREATRIAARRLRRQWRGAAADNPEILPHVDLIILRGQVLTRTPQPGQAVLIVLDALQPVGVCDVVMDKFEMLPQLGALATISPLAAVQLLEREGLLKLATIVAPVGVPREGEVALRAKVCYPDERQVELEVRCGTIEVFPVPAGQTVTLEIYPSRRFDLGMGRGVARAADIEGSAVGIVIDARGRPLVLPRDSQERRSLMREWLWSMGG